MRLKTVEDSDSARVLMSEPIDHGDWPFRFSIRVQYCEYWSEEWARDGKYHAALEVTSPVACAAQLDSVRSSVGLDAEEFDALPDEARHLCVADYGCKATLWQAQGNNLNKLVRQARAELKGADMLFGFYMDRPCNALGSSGWDFVAGNPLGSYARA